MDVSPFSSRLGSNYAPTEQEAIQLSQFLSEPMAKIVKLEEEMSGLLSIHTGLLAQHDTQRREIENHRSLMAPMRRPPEDLIQKIFLHCLPTEHNSLMSCHECPMLLTQVCRRWRRIAHSTPSLWASIHIAIPIEPKPPVFYIASYPGMRPPQVPAEQILYCIEKARKRAAAVKTWLARSAEEMLRISLYERGSTPPSDVWSEIYDTVFDNLIDVSHRWQTLSLDASVAPLQRIAAVSQSGVPQLRSLSISKTMADFQSKQFVPIDSEFMINSGLLKAPLLHEIEYKDDLSAFIRFPLKWTQMTAITLRVAVEFDPNTSFSGIVNLLKSCPLLVSCRLDVPHLEPWHENHLVSPISLPKLEMLSIRIQTEYYPSLFNALEVPCLRTLAFPLSDVVDQPFVDSVFAFFCRIASTVRNLAINPCAFTKAQFYQCLQLCPRLSTLKLIKGCMHPRWNSQPLLSQRYFANDDLLRAFVDPGHNDNGFLLPDLTTFECRIMGQTQFSDKMIVEFVKQKRSQLPHLAVLRRIVILLDRAETRPMTKELRQYVDDGLECYLAYTQEHLTYNLDSAYAGAQHHTYDRRPWCRESNLLQF